jgi:hypothetical protein
VRYRGVGPELASLLKEQDKYARYLPGLGPQEGRALARFRSRRTTLAQCGGMVLHATLGYATTICDSTCSHQRLLNFKPSPCVRELDSLLMIELDGMGALQRVLHGGPLRAPVRLWSSVAPR